GTPSQPDDFTATLRVRVTDSFGNVGEDRKTVAVHHDASLSPGFPIDAGVSGESSIALVDIDQDNKLDIVEAGSDGRIYVFEENGNAMAGFPVSADPVSAFDSGSTANHLASAGYLSGQVIPSPDN